MPAASRALWKGLTWWVFSSSVMTSVCSMWRDIVCGGTCRPQGILTWPSILLVIIYPTSHRQLKAADLTPAASACKIASNLKARSCNDSVRKSKIPR